MLIAVVSDTHCIKRYIDITKEKIKKADILIHLGDNSSDIKEFEKDFSGPIYVVDGNCDYRDECPKEILIDVNGIKIFGTHGHLYGVKRDLNSIYYRGREVGANIVLFGHSHVETIEREDNIILMNPGSTSIPKGRGNSIGFIEITDNGEINPRVEYLLK